MDIVYTTESSKRFNSCGKTHVRRCIDGSFTGCGNCVGYCNFHEHPGYLTKDLRKKHNCVNKACRYYERKQKAIINHSPFVVLATLI